MIELPKKVVDTSQQIVSSCNLPRQGGKSSFVFTGRGGIAPSPTEPLMNDAVLADWITLPTETGNISADIQEQHTQPVNLSDGLSSTVGDRSAKIIEAQGWQVDRNGNVVLVAQTPNLNPHNSMLNSSACATLGG